MEAWKYGSGELQLNFGQDVHNQSCHSGEILNLLLVIVSLSVDISLLLHCHCGEVVKVFPHRGEGIYSCKFMGYSKSNFLELPLKIREKCMESVWNSMESPRNLPGTPVCYRGYCLGYVTVRKFCHALLVTNNLIRCVVE